jgi:iron(III) transport system ATP-binding protein
VSDPEAPAPGDEPALVVAGLAKTFGDVPALDGAELVARAGEVVAVLGPSGSGKSTLLRCIAGLERPDGGSIRIGGTDVFSREVDVPPERRGIGMVFQTWALFPHLDVAANVGYGLPRAERKGPRVDDLLELVGLRGFEQREPDTLSGGQQQRVALARAVAPRPDLLLLDEPFSNLDASLRARVRGEVRSLLADLGITTVVVTHDQAEAFVLGDSVAVVREGRVVQQAGTRELYRRPVDPWVAAFVGDANLLVGEAHGSVAETALGPVPLAVDRRGRVTVLVRPEDVAVRPLVGGARGECCGTVRAVEYLGHDVIASVARADGATVTVRTRDDALRPGDEVALRHDGPPAWAWPTDGSPSA